MDWYTSHSWLLHSTSFLGAGLGGGSEGGSEMPYLSCGGGRGGGWEGASGREWPTWGSSFGSAPGPHARDGAFHSSPFSAACVHVCAYVCMCMCACVCVCMCEDEGVSLSMHKRETVFRCFHMCLVGDDQSLGMATDWRNYKYTHVAPCIEWVIIFMSGVFQVIVLV